MNTAGLAQFETAPISFDRFCMLGIILSINMQAAITMILLLFMLPVTHSNPINAQQQPTQNKQCAFPIPRGTSPAILPLGHQETVR